MGYIQEFEPRLRHQLEDMCEGNDIDSVDWESFIRWVKAEVLQSYRNGVEVGAKQGHEPRAERKLSRFAKKNTARRER